MNMVSGVNILRNTATLEAWRAYNRKAYGPFLYYNGALVIIVAVSPILTTTLIRQHRPIAAFAVVGAALAFYILFLVFAVFRVWAYKRANPFVPPADSEPVYRRGRKRELVWPQT